VKGAPHCMAGYLPGNPHLTAPLTIAPDCARLLSIFLGLGLVEVSRRILGVRWVGMRGDCARGFEFVVVGIWLVS